MTQVSRVGLITSLLLTCAVSAHAQDSNDVRSCLRSGEVLTFVVKALKIQGGHLRIETREDTSSGPARIRIEAAMATENKARWIYKYNNDSASLIDATTGRLLQTQSKGIDASKSFDRVTDIDRTAGKLRHTDHVRPEKSYEIALPADLMDLSVTLLCARFWNLATGESRDVQMTYEGLLYDLNIKAVREEEVKTPLGKFTAVVLEPSQRGEPMGAFKKGAAFRLYVSREDHPRLVRFDSLAALVNLVALLENVQEGTPLVTASARDATPPGP